MFFPWKWYLKDLPSVPKNGLKVFSCFACGGGSSMGYKLAGFTVLGNCELDPKIAKVYCHNLHPKHTFIMDVRDFLNLPDSEIPDELFNLDVLDGSPPCSTFSTAGSREAAWGKEKMFAEGQKKQRLDDLFFTFIAIANRLRPKVVVAENVKGMLLGNAKGYVREIKIGFEQAGYDVQLFLLNAATMGVPQARERVFFIARRKDLHLPQIKMEFHEKPIVFGKVRSEHGIQKDTLYQRLLKKRKPTDRQISDIYMREHGKNIGFTNMIVHDNEVSNTISTADIYRYCDGFQFSHQDTVNVSTFPQDYDFMGKTPTFFCGMSVPPVMMAHIAHEVATQLFGWNRDQAVDSAIMAGSSKDEPAPAAGNEAETQQDAAGCGNGRNDG